MLAIIDYGVGNLFSLKSSLKAVGVEAVVTSDIEEIKKADRFINDGLVSITENNLSLTPDGFLISNYIISELIN